MSKPLLRYTLDITKVNEININIEAYQRVINDYEDYIEKNGEYDYVKERIEYLNSILAEYLVAREFAKEQARTYGSELDG